MPMKGRFPIRRTLQYLQKGDIIFKNRVKIMTPNDDGEQVLVDVEGKDHKDIAKHIRTILGKSQAVLELEAQAKMQASNPANFGPKKYCLRECICEVEGQVPCPSTTPLPKEMTGKYRAQMRAAQE